MASLQTQVFVNGQWRNQRVTTDEILEPHDKPTVPAPPKPPNYGILTRSVIKSPIVRWVLPVQLRSSRFNDVALVGDQSVQICELDSDLQLQPIAKVDFDSKIRNCRVMGTHDYLRRRREDIHANYYRSGDVGMTSCGPSTSPPTLSEGDELFQQVLVLVLSAGELVFLIMNRNTTGDWKFAPSHFPIFGKIDENGRYTKHGESGGMMIDPGFHMTISPDGGYLALACSENLLIVYQLESIAKLRSQHAEGQHLQPIQSIRARAIKGAIHKIDFLHPGSEKPSLVVLLVITAQSGVLRLVTYDWTSLQGALVEEKRGHRLDESAGLPVLVIPLTICCRFLIITEHSMLICSDILSGPPVFFPFELEHLGATEWHHGTHNPMWTAWTRPSREESYHADTDVIYLAREDGWINSLEISSDSDVEASIYYGPLECNIDSGFASLSTFNGELIIAGGDYGPGAIWHLHPREKPKRIGLLPNWSPTVNLVLKKDVSGPCQPEYERPFNRLLQAEKPQGHIRTPEKIFICSGRDKFGAIIELRYGLQAKIGLDLLYPSPIKRCWAIPSFDGTPEAGFLMLLALPENSALLHISHDLSEVSEKDQDTVNFDLLSPTLAVYVSADLVVQITASYATILSPTSCYQHLLSDMVEDASATITDSAITRETLALSVYSQSIFKIMVFTFDKTRFVLTHTIDEPGGEVTALSLSVLSVGVCILAGISCEKSSTLVIFPLDPQHVGGRLLSNTQREATTLVITGEAGSTGIHAITSIVCHGEDKIVIGKRDGDVLALQLMGSYETGQRLIVTRANHFGASTSRVFAGPVLSIGHSTLVCNDAGLAVMKEADGPNGGSLEGISRIWLTDANEPHSPSPTIHSVAKLHEIPGFGDSTWAMIAGPHILITELQSHPAPVPRCIPIEGTPLDILYSERLGALVTVVQKGGVPSLHFFDPDTGADLSHPIRKLSDQDNGQHVDVNYITYLGNSNIKIASLMGWRYKSKYEWFVILAKSGDSQGLLLVISAEQEEAGTDAGRPRRIRFWNQFQRKIKDGLPRSGATDNDGMFLNFGKTLEYHVIEDKKFKTAMRYDLPSPASSLEVIGGHLHVLTTHHSLLILDYKSNIALQTQRMVQLHVDSVARNGLHSIDVGSLIGVKDRQKLVLVSDPLCGVYGLWSSGHNHDPSNFQLIFRAHLTVSIRKFVSGYTRPRWANNEPQFEYKHALSDKRDILGLAIDGSLTQFSILHEDVWRLLRYIQNLTVASGDTFILLGEHDSTENTQLDPDSVAKTKTHVDGDILQKCLDKKILEQIVSTPQQIVRLRELLLPLGLGAGAAGPQMLEETSLVYKYTYSILEYYLSPVL